MLLLALAVVLAFLLDGTSTVVALRAGGVETNPFVSELGPAAYALSCVLRCALALLVLRVALRVRAAWSATRLGLSALVAVKLAAALSNVVFVWRGAPLWS